MEAQGRWLGEAWGPDWSVRSWLGEAGHIPLWRSWARPPLGGAQSSRERCGRYLDIFRATGSALKKLLKGAQPQQVFGT